jgi:hypothetical protein
MAARPTRAASPSATTGSGSDETKVMAPELSLMNAMRDYVSKLIGVPGMKVFLMDSDTVR